MFEVTCIAMFSLELSRVDSEGYVGGSMMIYLLTAIFKILVLIYTMVKVYLISKRNAVKKQER